MVGLGMFGDVLWTMLDLSFSHLGSFNELEIAVRMILHVRRARAPGPRDETGACNAYTDWWAGSDVSDSSWPIDESRVPTQRSFGYDGIECRWTPMERVTMGFKDIPVEIEISSGPRSVQAAEKGLGMEIDGCGVRRVEWNKRAEVKIPRT
jgi:hypothetical protein